MVRRHPRKVQRVLPGEGSEVDEHYLGPMITNCSICGALHFLQEKTQRKASFKDCCCHGKVILDWDTSGFPDELKKLFLREHRLSRKFHEHIRNYYSAMSFASINCKQDKRTQGGGPYCFDLDSTGYPRLGSAT